MAIGYYLLGSSLTFDGLSFIYSLKQKETIGTHVTYLYDFLLGYIVPPLLYWQIIKSTTQEKFILVLCIGLGIIFIGLLIYSTISNASHCTIFFPDLFSKTKTTKKVRCK